MVVWGYVSELILSLLTLYFLGISFGWSSIHQWTIQIASDFTTIVLMVLLAGALTITCTIYSKSDTPFFICLEKKGLLKPYMIAFNSCTMIFLVSAIASVVARKSDIPFISYACAFLFILSTINAYTMLKNLADLFRLNMAFNARQGP